MGTAALALGTAPVSAQPSTAARPAVERPFSTPLPPATPIVAYSPVTINVPNRLVPLEARVTMPLTGDNLPILLLSHGHGQSNYLSSIRGYGPLVDFYGAHGFVVIQVTHQDSKILNLNSPPNPEGATFWRSRAEDFHYILDHLDEIEATVPGLAGRVDRTKIAVVGHSMGGHTSALLAGATVTDIHTGDKVDLSEPRISAFIMIAPAGDGKDAAPWLRENYPENLNTDYGTMNRPALVIVGDKDFNPNFSTRHSWRADAYNQAPSPKTLLTVFGAEHIFGGISGWDANETSDENPSRVAGMQQATWAYLRSALYPEDKAWPDVVEEMSTGRSKFGRVDTK
ncbi:MAG: chlorophyllase [Stutzerimonas stutzeri]|nr:MAG: chlorophyllase [Stutzerimonas stutzeri]